jgi:hypothetical protein
MMRIQRRWLLRIAIPLVAALGLVVWALERSQNVVTIENQSGQPISVLKLTRGGETKSFQDVPVGAHPGAITKEGGPFTVDGRLADGTFIRARFGEVDARVDLVLFPGGQLQFRKRKE